ncbi:DUF6221 family protein [Streptomyces sp. NPDC085944]|uniref:DUF6221 family protein n=1 Tax=Streptomyces sp. NPDC085944 TaxID=3154962 RepID=UPI003413F9A1
MNDEFLQWLREQLDDDERTARAVGSEQWHPRYVDSANDQPDTATVSLPDGSDVAVMERYSYADAEHIARHDPARVLAEVEAKRGVLRQYIDLREQVRNPVSAENRSRARALQGEIGDILRLLALPYADRPGYRDEWRP